MKQSPLLYRSSVAGRRAAVWLVGLILAAAIFTGCGNRAETPVPLPTAKVPSLFDVNGAIDTWKNTGNKNYFISVEEMDNNGSFLYRIVVVEGEIRAAQRLEKLDGAWQQPVAIDAAEAEQYTVDALLDRVLRDVNGEGEAPLNMFVVFDHVAGYPTLVDAKAIPSYTGDGTIRLNREFSYVLTVSVNVLLEESFGLSKTPILTLTRSGGESAACSTLRIYNDGSSVYSDNCRQILLQLRPPEDSFTRLQALSVNLAETTRTRMDGEQSQEFILHGSGSGAADPDTVDEIWGLAVSLDQLLSRPIGEGITLLLRSGSQVVGFDLRTNLEQPASLDLVAPFHGGIVDRQGRLLIYSDGAGLKWLDTVSGDAGTYTSNTESQWVVPIDVTGDGHLLLNRYMSGSDVPEWGWISTEDRTWHPLPDVGGCVSGAAANPLDGRLAVTTSGGDDCESESAVWMVDLTDQSATPIAADLKGAWRPAWSPDGTWLAFAASEGNAGGSEPPTQLYLARPDGSERSTLTGQAAGRVTGLAWSRGGTLAYGLAGAGGTAEDGLYELDPSSGEILHSLEGENLTPIGFDSSGEFLAFSDGSDLLVWVLAFGQVQSASRGTGETGFIGFVGETD